MIECLASVAQILPEKSSVPASCSVSDLEFLNILYINEKQRKLLVKDKKIKFVFLSCTAIVLKSEKKPNKLNFNKFRCCIVDHDKNEEVQTCLSLV